MPKDNKNAKAMQNMAKRAHAKPVPMKEAVKPLVKRAMGKGRQGC